MATTEGRAQNLLSFQYTSSEPHPLPFTFAIILYEEWSNVQTLRLIIYIFTNVLHNRNPSLIDLFFADTTSVKYYYSHKIILHIDGISTGQLKQRQMPLVQYLHECIKLILRTDIRLFIVQYNDKSEEKMMKYGRRVSYKFKYIVSLCNGANTIHCISSLNFPCFSPSRSLTIFTSKDIVCIADKLIWNKTKHICYWKIREYNNHI